MSYLDNVEAPKNHLDDADFDFLVSQLFTKVDGVSHQNLGEFPTISSKKVYVIEQFIKQWKTFIGPDIMPAAPLIFPNKAKRLYYIRDTTLARLVVKMLKISPKSQDYDKLFNWKKHYHEYKHHHRRDTRNLKSLPFIIAQIYSERRDPDKIVKPTIKISEVNKVLETLTTDEASKSAQQVAILEPVVEKLTIEQLRWFFTILLKISTLGSFETAFFERWHPDAPRLYGLCNNLSKVFWLLTDPEVRLTDDQLTIQPFYPFLPQLSQKVNISYEKLCARMNNAFYIEEKMDGDRMILHFQDSRFKFFSRRTKDYTLLYGASFQIGSLTKYLTDAFHPRVKSIVLDGEMVAWDFKRKVILPFGTLKTSAVQEAVRQFTTTDVFEEQSAWPLFIVFDVLHVNGKNLTNHKLSYRKQLLRSLINEIPHKFELLPLMKGSDPDDIKLAIKNVISDRGEGLVIKNVDLKYHVAQRDNSWVKVKPEYLEQFGENLDLVIIGLIPAVKNSYMCGLRDKENGNVFKSFCTVANGFTEGEFDRLERLTAGKWNNLKTNPPPTDLIQFGRKKPDFWINPNDSVALEIKARSIDVSLEETYAVGTTLHNLYCRRIRDDKLIEDCVTLQEYREMKLKYSSDFNKSQTILQGRKRKANSFLLEQASKQVKTEVTSNLFSNFQFLILSDCKKSRDNERLSVEDLSRIVKLHGGMLIRNHKLAKEPDRQTIVISEVAIPSTEAIVNYGLDILKLVWVFNCIESNAIVPLEPSMIFRTRSVDLLKNSLARLDVYGDSFTQRVDLPIVEFCRRIENPQLTDNDIKCAKEEFLHELGDNPPLAFLFNDVKFLIVAAHNWAKDGLRRKVERYGGQISETLGDCSFVVVANEEGDETLAARIDVISHDIADSVSFSNSSNLPIPSIVKSSFIDLCIEHRVLVDAADFSIGRKSKMRKN